jgi:hypothetical protein
MINRIRIALAALLVAFAIAFSASAFGFSQADVAGIRPKEGTSIMAGGGIKYGS